METEEIFKIIGQNIRTIRESKGLSLKDISKLSGIRVEYLSKIENGKARGMLLSYLEFTALALGVELYILLEGT